MARKLDLFLVAQYARYRWHNISGISMLTKNKPGSTHKGYHWVYHDPVKKWVCFRYQKGRGREGPKEFLKDFQGTLQSDGYAVYDNLKPVDEIQQLACMAHARREFDQAKSNDAPRANHALGLIQQLYKIERRAAENELGPKAIGELRKKEAVPILKEFEAWMKEQLTQILPKSPIGKAINYTLKLWPRLMRYTTDGRFRIDNNLIENTIRPVALGRKNYLFAGSHEAAQWAAMVYSLLGTCKLNGVEPFDVLTRLPKHPINKTEELLSHRWKPMTEQNG